MEPAIVQLVAKLKSIYGGEVTEDDALANLAALEEMLIQNEALKLAACRLSQEDFFQSSEFEEEVERAGKSLSTMNRKIGLRFQYSADFRFKVKETLVYDCGFYQTLLKQIDRSRANC